MVVHKAQVVSDAVLWKIADEERKLFESGAVGALLVSHFVTAASGDAHPFIERHVCTDAEKAAVHLADSLHLHEMNSAVVCLDAEDLDTLVMSDASFTGSDEFCERELSVSTKESALVVSLTTKLYNNDFSLIGKGINCYKFANIKPSVLARMESSEFTFDEIISSSEFALPVPLSDELLSAFARAKGGHVISPGEGKRHLRFTDLFYGDDADEAGGDS